MKKRFIIVVAFVLLFLMIGLNACNNSKEDSYCKHNNPNKIVKIPAVAPTCEKNGLTEGMKCKLCGTMVVPQVTLDKIQCVESDWIIDEKQVGIRYTQCIYCGKVINVETNSANDRLNAVMSDGAKGYKDITSSITIPDKFVDPSSNNRTASIVAVYEEISGLGYVIEVVWTSEYTHGSKPGLVLVGISKDGKIIAVNNEVYNDSFNIFDQAPNYASSFEGQDSTLGGVGLVAGSTHSSSAFRSAVSHAFEVLVLNNMITAGVKSDERILTEMITTIAPSFTKLTEITASGTIVKALKSNSGFGFALIMNDGSANYLAVVNAFGYCEVYDTEGIDVSADHPALVEEASNFAKENSENYYDGANKPYNAVNQFKKLMPGATDFAPIENVTTFGTIVTGASFNVDGVTYYGFYSRVYGFEQMDIYFIIDEDGKIAKMNAVTFIFEPEYFFQFGGVPNNYTGGFVGLDSNSFDGSQSLIASATMTSNAVKQATEDSFAAFNSIK